MSPLLNLINSVAFKLIGTLNFFFIYELRVLIYYVSLTLFLYRDGGDEKSELLRQFCGTSTKETTLATTGSNVFIRLITDYETTQRGFNLTWDAKSPRKLWKYTSLSRYQHMATLNKTSDIYLYSYSFLKLLGKCF